MNIEKSFLTKEEVGQLKLDILRSTTKENWFIKLIRDINYKIWFKKNYGSNKSARGSK